MASKKVSFIISLILLSATCWAQYPSFVVKKSFNIGLTGGISSSGLKSSFISHAVSLHILSGTSAGNRIIEIGGLSNYSLFQTTGIQISGISNVVGGYQPHKLKNNPKIKPTENDFNLSFYGFQLSGGFNLVGGGVNGVQFSGISNIVSTNLIGLQISGGLNIVNGFSLGTQLSGIGNISRSSIDGLQLAGLYNFTAGDLNGAQISAINLSKSVNLLVKENTSFTLRSIQLGVVNYTQFNGGIQFGLINIARHFKGYQIGLINFCKEQEGRPIGLLNFTSKGGHGRVFASESFLTNYEVTTGSEKIQNFITFSMLPVSNGNVTRAFGYGIGKVKYNEPSHRKYRSMELHYFKPMLDNTWMNNNILMAKYGRGQVVHLGRIVFYAHGALTLNIERYSGKSINEIPSLSWGDKNKIKVWPGLNLGIHVH